VAEVGILIVDDDIANQQALKLILDSEGWRVRIVPAASQALAELATGSWDLAIVNVTLLDIGGPLFATLRELVLAQRVAASASPQAGDLAEATAQHQPKRFRALFLVPLMGSKEVPLLLERQGLPYSFKPYHLHDFLEKVSELLLESGALAEPLRSVSGFENKKRRGERLARDAHGGKKMFASREDYQMSEEDLAEYERQEKEDEERKRLAKQMLDRKPF
jgi:CheY-like chemotaxis protein